MDANVFPDSSFNFAINFATPPQKLDIEPLVINLTTCADEELPQVLQSYLDNEWLEERQKMQALYIALLNTFMRDRPPLEVLVECVAKLLRDAKCIQVGDAEQLYKELIEESAVGSVLEYYADQSDDKLLALEPGVLKYCHLIVTQTWPNREIHEFIQQLTRTLISYFSYGSESCPASGDECRDDERDEQVRTLLAEIGRYLVKGAYKSHLEPTDLCKLDSLLEHHFTHFGECVDSSKKADIAARQTAEFRDWVREMSEMRQAPPSSNPQ